MTRVGVIGGGFSGAIAAYHVLKSLPAGAEVVVHEPHPELGRGVAYADLPDHFLLNVPARLLSPFPEDPENFLRWVLTNRAADAGKYLQPDGSYYAPRAWFGAYVCDLLTQRINTRRDATLRHVRTPVLKLATENGRPLAITADGASVFDAVILALGNAPSRPLRLRAGASSIPAVVQSAWDLGRLAPPPPQARVTIVGTGLTMVDAVTDLIGRGHQGIITCVSRHGLFHNRSTGHNPEFTPPAEPLERTIRGMTRQIRRWCALSTASLGDWRPAMDYVRINAPKFWRHLEPAEQARFGRHVRHLWDVHRFQVPPQSDDLIRQLEAAARFVRLRGRAHEVCKDGLIVLRDGVQHLIPSDVVINATGPDLSHRTNHASLDNLLAPLGIDIATAITQGVNIADDGHVLEADPNLRGRIWALGSLARRRFGELGNVGAIVRVAEKLGPALCARIAM